MHNIKCLESQSDLLRLKVNALSNFPSVTYEDVVAAIRGSVSFEQGVFVFHIVYK